MKILQSIKLGQVALFFCGLSVFAAGMYLFGSKGNPLLVLIPLIGCVCLFIIGRYPQYGYYLIIFLIPMSAWQGLMEKYPFLTISKLVGVWVIIISLIMVVLNRQLFNRLKSRIWVPLAFLYLVCTISVMFSGFDSEGITFLRRLAVAYSFVALTLFFVRRFEMKTVIPMVLISSTGLAALTGTLGKLLHIDSLMIAVQARNITDRAVGATSNPNFFAAMVILSLPLIAYYIFSKPSWKWKIVLSLLFLNNCYAVFISYSRSQLLVLIAVLFILVLEHIRKLRLKYIGFVMAALMVLLAGAAYKLPQTTLWSRMATLQQPTDDRSLQRRASYYKVAYDSLKTHFFWGSGPGSYTRQYEKSLLSAAFSDSSEGFARSAHNTYLELLTETGILGFACFIWMLATGIRAYVDTARISCDDPEMDDGFIRSMGYSMLSFMMSMFFFSNLQHKYLWMFIGLAMVFRNLTGRNTAHLADKSHPFERR